MRASLWFLLLALVATGCATSDECDASLEPQCWYCCGDHGAAAECRDGEWTCPPGTNDLKTCVCAPPPASSLKPCVDADSGVCLDACQASGEYCVAMPACGAQDGGACTDADGGTVYEARCHRRCDWFEHCAAGEACITTTVSCGAEPVQQSRVCCAPGTCP